MHRFQNIAVLGSGTMGHAIAMLLAANGLQVSLYDPSSEALAAARCHIAAKLPSLETSHNGAQPQLADKIRYTANLQEAAADADLIFEAVPERIEIKRELFGRLETMVKQTAVIASNTSSYSLETLIEGREFAGRMIIAHFFNPAHLVPLVELVGHAAVPAALIEEVAALLRDCGKTPVILQKDIPGFIANRLQAAVLREASYLLACGVADAKQIDLAMTAGPGLRWALNGPFEIADFGGLDVWDKVCASLFPKLSGEDSAPAVIREKVSEGKLGIKSGEGIYSYDREEGAGLPGLVEAREQALQRMLRAKQN